VVQASETLIRRTLDRFKGIDALLNIASLLAFMVAPAAKWMTGTSVRMESGEIQVFKPSAETSQIAHSPDMHVE
jgi:hypothetical protein